MGCPGHGVAVAFDGAVVTGSWSRVLWDVLEKSYVELGCDAVGNDTFRKLVLARAVVPISKADALRV